MRAGDTKELVFIDDSPFCIQEHQWRNSDDKWHTATCISKINDAGCPADGARGVGRPDYVGHTTIIDVTGYTAKDGTENKYRLMLLPAKTKFLNKLKKKKENKGSLLGQLWSLSRADSNAPNTGDDLDHIREINMEKLYPLVTYKGKNIKEMIDRANGKDEDAKRTRAYLVHHFQIPESGDVPQIIPIFNYAELMAPMEPGALRSLIADAKPFNQTGRSGNTSSSSFSSDDVPF